VETFTRLFGSLLLFVYHCFDRVVISGYLSGLSRPGQVVHFFQNVVGEPVIGKEVLSRRTNEYQAWVEAFGTPQQRREEQTFRCCSSGVGFLERFPRTQR
jgi:hypothetical protein